MVVAAHEALVANEAAARRDDAEVQRHHALRHLEDRARRILSHQGAVQHRLGNVGIQLLVVLATYAAHQQVGVVARRTDHGQHLAGARLQSHHATALVGHNLLGILLQVGVNCGVQVPSLHGQRVVHAVGIGAYLAVVHIHMHQSLALHTAQHLLVALLQAALAYVVTPLVVRVAVQVALVHLAHIAQHLRRYRAVVDAQRALRDIEALEAEHLVLELGILRLRNLLHEYRRRIGRILACLLHALLEVLEVDAEAPAEIGRVEVLNHARNDHQVVHSLVVHQQLAVAVVDEAARRILRHIAQRLPPRQITVFRVEQLQHRQPPYEQDAHDDEDGLDHPSAIRILVRHNCVFNATASLLLCAPYIFI